MKNTTKLLSAAIAIGAVLAGGMIANSAYASQEAEKAANQVANDYMVAFNSHDAEKMLSDVQDTREKTEAALKARYQNYVKKDTKENTHLKLLNVVKTDDGNFQANFEVSSDVYETAPVSLPIVQNQGEWKVLVGSSVVHSAPKTNK